MPLGPIHDVSNAVAWSSTWVSPHPWGARGTPTAWPVYDRGHRIFEVTCFCGKRLLTWAAYRDHMTMKHPKVRRRMRKSGHWAQTQLEFRA